MSTLIDMDHEKQDKLLPSELKDRAAKKEKELRELQNLQ